MPVDCDSPILCDCYFRVLITPLIGWFIFSIFLIFCFSFFVFLLCGVLLRPIDESADFRYLRDYSACCKQDWCRFKVRFFGFGLWMSVEILKALTVRFYLDGLHMDLSLKYRLAQGVLVYIDFTLCITKFLHLSRYV